MISLALRCVVVVIGQLNALDRVQKPPHPTLSPGGGEGFGDALIVQESPFAYYVGQDGCRECHSEPTRTCGQPAVSRHGSAFDALSTRRAVSIAALNGVHSEPSKHRLCLECHTAGADEGPRWQLSTFRLSDGVQCESCHGPGSLHAISRRPQDIRRSDVAACATCHDERPSHREVLDRGFRLAAQDTEYKTPVNLAISPDGKRLFVVCEHSDSVVVVDTERRAVVAELAVGRRPHAAVVSPDGAGLFVTNRMEGTLAVIDVDSLRVVRQIPIGGDVHGVAVTPSGDHVLVADTARNSIVVVETKTHKVVRRLNAGVAPWDIAIMPASAETPLSVSATSQYTTVRALVTNARPLPSRFREPHHSEITVVDLQQLIVAERPVVADANTLHGVSFVPGESVAILTMMRTKNLVPGTRLAQGWMMTNGLAVAWPHGRVDQVLLDQPDRYFPDPMDVAVSPDGRFACVASGGADEVAVLDVPALLAMIREFSDTDRVELLPNHLGVSDRFTKGRIPVGHNPRGLVFAPDGRLVYVANALDDTVSVIDPHTQTIISTISLGGPREVSQLRFGERLFHNAEITYGRQFSCRSCHPDGHLNGLTFDIEADGIGRSPVDNRSLRGIFDTAPFKWEGTNPSLHRQCGPRFAVFFTRMAPYDKNQLEALVRYMCTIEASSNPYRMPEGLSPSQRRGKAVFERTTMNDGTPLGLNQQCASCHRGAHRTNRRRANVGSTMWFDAAAEVAPGELFNANDYGELGTYFFIDAGLPTLGFDVAHLRGLHDGAPYLHNGGANTLEEIWTRFNMTNRHGETGDLTREQLNDLVAYLKSL